jgi:hypothetical protein
VTVLRRPQTARRTSAWVRALYHTVVDGAGPPLHTHRHEDGRSRSSRGGWEVECGDDRWVGGPGKTFLLPRGFAHTFRSVDGPATILFIVTPGRLDEFFRLKVTLANPADPAELVRRFC